MKATTALRGSLDDKTRKARSKSQGQGGRGVHSAKSGEILSPDTPHVADTQPYRYFNSGKVEDFVKNPCLKMDFSPHG